MFVIQTIFYTVTLLINLDFIPLSFWVFLVALGLDMCTISCLHVCPQKSLALPCLSALLNQPRADCLWTIYIGIHVIFRTTSAQAGVFPPIHWGFISYKNHNEAIWNNFHEINQPHLKKKKKWYEIDTKMNLRKGLLYSLMQIHHVSYLF